MNLPGIEKLVFLPGLDGTGISFEPLRAFIPDDVGVTVVKHPADRLLSFDEIVESAGAQVPAGENAAVLAESFGGLVAVRLVGSRRIAARCLILCAAFAAPPRPILLAVARMLPAPLLAARPLQRAFIRFALGGAVSYGALLPLMERITAAVPARTFAHRIRMIGRIDVRDSLAGIKAPVCCLQATEDRLVPPRSLQDFENTLPRLVVKGIRAPHFILQAQPEAALAAIDEFLRSITATR